jgi:hypothetical protein
MSEKANKLECLYTQRLPRKEKVNRKSGGRRGCSRNTFKIKTCSQEKNAVMTPLLLGMLVADAACAKKCFNVNIFVQSESNFQGFLIEQ